MHRRILLLLVASLLLLAVPAFAGSYNYISPEQVKTNMEHKAPMHIFDIQVEDEYAQHHLPGAMKSCAYPVKSDADKAKVDAFVSDLQKDSAPVVIICPRGKGGAERAYMHLKEKGVAEDRLFILEGGQGGWPYENMLEK